MPLNLATAGVMLCNIPRSLRHLCREVVRAFLGKSTNATTTFSYSLGGRRSRCEILFKSHPITVFSVDHATSPFPSFLR